MRDQEFGRLMIGGYRAVRGAADASVSNAELMLGKRARIICTFKAIFLETTSAQLVPPQNLQSLCSLGPLWFNPKNYLKNIS